jgi:membrane protease YdiL (CAAX protease family)
VLVFEWLLVLIALGAGLWALWMGLMNAHVLGGGTNAAQGLLPQGIPESLAWLPLALSAGFCEELAFRGDLQKQFQAITGSGAWAVLIKRLSSALAIHTKAWARS